MLLDQFSYTFKPLNPTNLPTICHFLRSFNCFITQIHQLGKQHTLAPVQTCVQWLALKSRHEINITIPSISQILPASHNSSAHSRSCISCVSCIFISSNNSPFLSNPLILVVIQSAGRRCLWREVRSRLRVIFVTDFYKQNQKCSAERQACKNRPRTCMDCPVSKLLLPAIALPEEPPPAAAPCSLRGPRPRSLLFGATKRFPFSGLITTERRWRQQPFCSLWHICQRMMVIMKINSKITARFHFGDR